MNTLLEKNKICWTFEKFERRPISKWRTKVGDSHISIEETDNREYDIRILHEFEVNDFKGFKNLNEAKNFALDWINNG